MHTLFDFMSSVNAVQYVLSLIFMVGFLVFNEILKPSPFKGLLDAVAEDAGFIKSYDRAAAVMLFKKMALAPVYVLLYLAALPLLFIQGTAVSFARGIASATSEGWSPVRAYFTGKKNKTKKNGAGQKTSDGTKTR